MDIYLKVNFLSLQPTLFIPFPRALLLSVGFLIIKFPLTINITCRLIAGLQAANKVISAGVRLLVSNDQMNIEDSDKETQEYIRVVGKSSSLAELILYQNNLV